jgi:hypothetical protein
MSRVSVTVEIAWETLNLLVKFLENSKHAELFGNDRQIERTLGIFFEEQRLHL